MIKPSVDFQQVLQVECHSYLKQHDLYNHCKEKGIVITAFGAVGLPQTTNRLCKSTPFYDKEIRRLAENTKNRMNKS